MMKSLVFNKQIILAAGMIVFIVAAVIGGTGAFFSDTESSTGNVFTAGAVNIAITDIAHSPSAPNLVGFVENENALSFSFSDLKPLDKGTVTYTLNNTDNEAFVCALVEETGNDDNGINEPEGSGVGGDTTNGVGNGELGQFLNFKFGSESGSLAAISGVWQTVGTIASGATSSAAIDYCFGTFSGSNCVLGSGNYNLAQTDKLTADVEFYAVQTRNNEDFDCSSLNPMTYVYNQGFEETLVDWEARSGGVLGLAADGTNGVPSADGGSHANVTGQAFTRWGGYSNTFPTEGYTTEVDVYLDMALATGGADLRFDFSSAINTADVVPAHRRDFIFHLGTDPLNNGQWLANASNNAPGNPSGAGSVSISTTGWYTLQSYFHDAGAGVLAVDMNIVDSNGVVVATWTRSDASDIIGVTVGGNRYGWFVNNAFTPLSFDNAQLYLGAPVN